MRFYESGGDLQTLDKREVRPSAWRMPLFFRERLGRGGILYFQGTTLPIRELIPSAKKAAA